MSSMIIRNVSVVGCSMAFSIPVAVPFQSRSLSSTIGSRRSHGRPRPSQLPALPKLFTHSVRMSTADRETTRTTTVATDDGILPRGAFTLVLEVKFKNDITLQDAKAILFEYGRKTCSEPEVLRCDIIYTVTKRGVPTGPYFQIWTTYENSRAYMDHERTSHATKLRVYLENPHGTDNAVLLTKLSHTVTLLRPVYPEPAGWQSNLDLDPSEDYVPTKRVTLSLPNSRGSMSDQESGNGNAQRKALNKLITNVGLEDVKIIVATACASSSETVRPLRGACEEYLKQAERSASIVRTGILVNRNNPYQHYILTVHDGDAMDAACFDTDVGSDYISDDGWKVSLCHGVFPDKVGWEIYIDENEAARRGFIEPTPAPPPSFPTSSAIARKEAAPSHGPRCRLLFGVTAFDDLKTYVRDLAGKQTGEVRVMFVAGWNQSRLYPLLHQLEYDRNKDVGQIIFNFGLSVRSCLLTVDTIREGIAAMRLFEADIVLGFGSGTVLDLTKLLGRFGKCTDDELHMYLSAIENSIESDEEQVILKVDRDPTGAMLVPATIGPGIEMKDMCIVGGQRKDGEWRRLPVYFDDRGLGIQPTMTTVLYDARLASPRRYMAKDAAQGALTIACAAIDTLMILVGSDDSTAQSLATQALGLSFKNVIPALREPETSSGQARDPLVKSRMMGGIAADNIGKLGLIMRLSLAVVDALVNGRDPHIFRVVVTRVTMGVIHVLCEDSFADVAGDLLKTIYQTMNVNGTHAIVQTMLRRTDDCNMPLLPHVGMVRRRIPEVATRVSLALNKVECSKVESIFKDANRIQQALESAISHEYEL